MLLLLKINGKMKIKDLSEKLEIEERMIRVYKDDLEMAGIYIMSGRGANGGYSLEGSDILVDLDVNKDEIAALEMALAQLNQSGFIAGSELEELYHKICVAKSKKANGFEDSVFFYKDIKSNDIVDEKEKIKEIINAYIEKKKIKINYYALNKNKIEERIVHPYSVVTYKGANYMVAFCEKRNEFRDFKISRIQHMETLREKYGVNDKFSFKEYMNGSIGIYKGDSLAVKLKIIYPMSRIVSEKNWVDNQKITWMSEEEILFEAEVKGKTELISWILSMGDKVEVLEPIELKDEIKNIAKNIVNMYKL